MPAYFVGCSKPEPVPTEPVQTQQQPLENRCSQLEAKLKTAEEQLSKKNQEYELIASERDKAIREKDRYYNQLTSYPKNTSEDVIKDNQRLKIELLKNNGTTEAGFERFLDQLEELRTLRTRLYIKTKQIENARPHLEKYNIYLSELTGKILDPAQSPLTLEKAEHAKTKSEIELLKSQYKMQENKYLTDITNTNLEFSRALKERDTYKNAYEQWKNYAKYLGGAAINPDNSQNK